MLKTLMSKFCSDLSVRLTYIDQKQIPAKLKPIVVFSHCLLCQFNRELTDRELTSTIKRQILASIAPNFDPLVLVAPFTPLAKLFMQHFWKLQL